MKAWLRNSNGGVRSTASQVYTKLSEEDLEHLWADIYVAAKYPAPSGVMFAGAVQAKGGNLIAEHRFEEGLPLALDYLYRDGWGKFARVPAALNALANYGSAVKPYLEEIREKEYKMWVTPEYGGTRPEEKGNMAGVQPAWEKILANLEKEFELRSLKPYLENTDVSPPERISPQEMKDMEDAAK